jgi:hypothetical protein
MKKSLMLSLLNSAIALRDCLGKFICTFSSLKNEENPPAGHPNAADYFTCHQALADYLKCSVNTVKIYKRTGVIPFTIVDGCSWTKKSDLIQVINLHPNISALFRRSLKPDPDAMRVYTRLARINETWGFIHLTFQGWKPQILVLNEFYEDKDLLKFVCSMAIHFQHKIKPFRYPPVDIKIAA